MRLDAARNLINYLKKDKVLVTEVGFVQKFIEKWEKHL